MQVRAALKGWTTVRLRRKAGRSPALQGWLAGATAVALAGTVLISQQRPAPTLLGSSAERAAAQRALESRMSADVSRSRIEEAHRHLAAKPHMAGTPHD